jgi:hypothetical protein
MLRLWSAPAVDFLQPVRLRGRVAPASEGDAVEIVTGTAARLRVVARTTAEAGGWFSALVRPAAASTFWARTADGGVSAPVRVVVRPLVALDLAERTRGGLAASGKVTPTARGMVLVQRSRRGRFATVRRLTVRKGRFAGTLKDARRGTYRAVFVPLGGGTTSYSEPEPWR